MQRGRPTRDKQNKIKKILQPYYQKGISASAASKVTQLNIKTVLKYFADWDKKLLESEDGDFLRRAKITKEKSIQALDKEIISLDYHEKEVNSLRLTAKKNGDIFNFEKLSRLILKIIDQKLKMLSTKINLINTPTADTIINLGEKDEQ